MTNSFPEDAARANEANPRTLALAICNASAIRQALFPPTKHRSARPRLSSTSAGRLNPLAMWRTARPGTTVGGSTRSEALGHDTNPRKDEHENERSEEKTPGSGAQRDLAETPAKFKMTIR
ncbi:hypothetical protein GQ607_016673 [Colletotrichum asianum]|uniref:Uncharacterized protein n=1 Tax=Colletotrichum asianum TaxID=702518 RepID=A0A8H3VXR0_9PEZI|nr:hypothetical protein GQ607_016673 [Colletotrichum asianum]